MTSQLVLIDSHSTWRMDRGTRERGVRGVARAREALAEARSRVIEAGAEDRTDPDEADLVPAA